MAPCGPLERVIYRLVASVVQSFWLVCIVLTRPILSPKRLQCAYAWAQTPSSVQRPCGRDEAHAVADLEQQLDGYWDRPCVAAGSWLTPGAMA